jgi:hypothetical protein
VVYIMSYLCCFAIKRKAAASSVGLGSLGSAVLIGVSCAVCLTNEAGVMCWWNWQGLCLRV